MEVLMSFMKLATVALATMALAELGFHLPPMLNPPRPARWQRAQQRRKELKQP
jgi:hypothetical protein